MANTIKLSAGVVNRVEEEKEEEESLEREALRLSRWLERQ